MLGTDANWQPTADYSQSRDEKAAETPYMRASGRRERTASRSNRSGLATREAP